MFRIHFTTEDLARTRIMASYGPYAETLFSLGAIADRRRSGVLFGEWHQRLNQAPERWMGPLGRLIDGCLPLMDLFTLIGPASTHEECRDNLLRIRRQHLKAEIDAAGHWAVASGPGTLAALPKWIFRLHDDNQARSGLANVLGAGSRTAVDPHWTQIHAHLEAEAALRARILAQHGLRQMLSGLHPSMRWHAGALHVSSASHTTTQVAQQIFVTGDVDVHAGVSNIHLGGRGLVLVPSVFCPRITPYVSVADPDAPVVLFYPAVRDVTDAHRLWMRRRPGSAHRTLVALLGTTRAAALEVLIDGSTTTELARRLNVSPATASHHATILRAAGLISTRRHGGAVLHTVTPLGIALLNGTAPPGR